MGEEPLNLSVCLEQPQDRTDVEEVGPRLRQVRLQIQNGVLQLLLLGTELDDGD